MQVIIMAKITSESLWLILSIALVIAVMILLFLLLAGMSPSGIFDLFQGFMAMVAMYLVSQLHAILR